MACQTFTIKKNWRSQKLLGKKVWRNALALKSKKVKGILRETLILALSFSDVFRLQNHVSDLFFDLVCSGKKGFYQSSLGNEVDFMDIMNVFPNIYLKLKIKNFENLKHGFVDERAMITMTLISSCHWKTFVPFWLGNKIPENAFLTLNCRKTVQKSKLFHSKQKEIGHLMI